MTHLNIPKKSIFFKNNALHPALIELFALLDIEHEGTLQSIVDQGQKHLLRKAGVERWDIHGSKYEEKRTAILACLETLGFVVACEPLAGHYDSIVIFGFVTIDIKRHFDFITSYLASHHIKGGTVVLLSSSLPIPAFVACPPGCTTEAELMYALFKESSYAHYPCRLIDVAMIQEHGHVRRPTTADTIQAWLSQNPSPGSVLAVSGQPFIHRQTHILQKLLPPTCSLYTSGIEAESDLPIAVYLDELARALYEYQ